MKFTILLLTAVTIPSAVPVRAQSAVNAADREAIRGIPDRWGLTLGGFWQTFETNVRLDGETGRGTDLNLERDLGMDRNVTSLGLAGFYRFSDRNRLDLAYVPWSRGHSSTIDRQIHWGDVTYDAGATITAKAKSQMLNAIYRYSFFNNGRVIFGLNAGISALWNDFSLTGEGTISGGTGVSGTITERKKVIVPIPVDRIAPRDDADQEAVLAVGGQLLRRQRVGRTRQRERVHHVDRLLPHETLWPGRRFQLHGVQRRKERVPRWERSRPRRFQRCDGIFAVPLLTGADGSRGVKGIVMKEGKR